MSSRMRFLVVLLLLPALASAEIYKCTDPNGKASYSDRPCSASSTEESVKIEEGDWVERLRSSVPYGIEISSVSKDGAETTVKFNFAKMEQSSQFLRLAAKVSGQSVALTKVVAPDGDRPGSAEMKVSGQMPNIFRKRAEANSS